MTAKQKNFTETVQLFFESRKSKETRRTYIRCVEATTDGDPAKFLAICAKDKGAGEMKLIRWVLANREADAHSKKELLKPIWPL